MYSGSKSAFVSVFLSGKSFCISRGFWGDGDRKWDNTCLNLKNYLHLVMNEGRSPAFCDGFAFCIISCGKERIYVMLF